MIYKFKVCQRCKRETARKKILINSKTEHVCNECFNKAQELKLEDEK